MRSTLDLARTLGEAARLDELLMIVRRAARELNGADGATVIFRDGNQCFYADEDAIGPLWKGRRFPMSACISGWVMLNKQVAVIEDIYMDTRIPLDAYRPTFVRSLMMVPVNVAAPTAAIGNYWADRHCATEDEISGLAGLADHLAAAISRPLISRELGSYLSARENG